MIVIQAGGPVTDILRRLERFEVEHHIEWASFVRRARTAACAVVVLREDRVDADDVRLRLHALMQNPGPVPLVIVDTTRHPVQLDRLPVEAVVGREALDELAGSWNS